MVYIWDIVDRVNNNFHNYLFISVVIALVITIFFIFYMKKTIEDLSYICSFWSFCFYMVLLFGETLFGRWITEVKIWTQDAIGVKQLFQNPWYVVSAVENIVMFIPFGFLVIKVFYKFNSWWKCLLVACMVSSAIEIMQYIFKLGESQIMDICMNAIGAVVGFALENVVHFLWKKMRKIVDAIKII